jgi:hypothetical protein
LPLTVIDDLNLANRLRRVREDLGESVPEASGHMGCIPITHVRRVMGEEQLNTVRKDSDIECDRVLFF